MLSAERIGPLRGGGGPPDQPLMQNAGVSTKHAAPKSGTDLRTKYVYLDLDFPQARFVKLGMPCTFPTKREGKRSSGRADKSSL